MSSQFACRGLYIGNEWVQPQSGSMDAVINPATQEVIATVPVGGRSEVDRALDAARQAFDHGPWPRMSPKARAQILQRLHDGLLRRAAEIASLIVAEAGATQALAASMHFAAPLQHFQYFIDLLVKRDFAQPVEVQAVPGFTGGKVLAAHVKVYEPIGVVAGITAYNFPFFLNLVKVAPALAAGNTIILKPSPYTPLEALVIAEVAEEVGLPPGVLNVLTGDATVGEALTTDPRVDQVSFTGSDVVGAKIMAQAAPTLKRIQLELGGKSALIVCADADLEAAATAGLINFTVQAGQGCVLATRAIVHNSVKAQYVDTVARMARQMKLGNPTDPSVQMGPLIRDAQRARVERFVQSGLDSGARLVCGGRRPKGLDQGFFYEPTLFDDVDNSSEIAQEEIFGPVGVVIGFDTDEEAIRIANDSKYGLGGGVFSRNVGHAYEMALRLRTGGVSINGGAGAMSSKAPFGGVKRSGIGREYGEEGLNEYLQIKTIDFHGG